MKRLVIFLMVVSSLLVLNKVCADASLYRGLATTHLFMDNDGLNNNNEVTVLDLDGLLVGYMTNSYNNRGHFLGYQYKVYDSAGVQARVGGVIVDGYKRWQMPLLRTTAANQYDDVVVPLPIANVSYSLTDHLALQGNVMGLFVVNVGVRIDF